MSLTEEENKLLLAKIHEREIKESRKISVSTFLRDTVLPILNGNNPDTKQETEQEAVSPSERDTISEQKNKGTDLSKVDDPWNYIE